MPLERDDGVVLRRHPLGEADRIITLLTRRRGKVRAVAKGVRKTSSRFGARLEPGTHVDVLLWRGRGDLGVVTQAQAIAPYGERLVADWDRWSAASALLEAADRLADVEDEPQPGVLALLLGGLAALAADRHEPRLVVDAFLLRGLRDAGYEPALETCAGCGADGPHAAFSPSAGGSVCSACRPAGSTSPGADVLTHLVALRDADWPTATGGPARVRRDASGLVAATWQWHTERGLRTLAHVEPSR